jgi:hypothetical protein
MSGPSLWLLELPLLPVLPLLLPAAEAPAEADAAVLEGVAAVAVENDLRRVCSCSRGAAVQRAGRE